MINRIKLKTGDLIKIPYKAEWHTYGRILIEGSYAIYDCPSSKNRSDSENIIKSDLLFVAHVDVFAVREGYWTIIENIPLEERLKNFYPKYFNANPASPEDKNFYEVYKDEIEHAIKKDWIKTGKIQLDGIYGRIHIESRINDYYEGKKNKYVHNDIWIFKNSLGLPTDGPME